MHAPASQSVQPGAWVSLGFVVKSADQSKESTGQTHQPEVGLPLGWSLLLPPRPVDLGANETQIITVAVAVPKHAPAGSHRVVLTIGDESVGAEVSVEATYKIQWLGDLNVSNRPNTPAATQSIHRWWPDRPWTMDEALILTGNQTLDIRLVGRVPTGVKINIEKNEHHFVPGIAHEFSIAVSLDASHRRAYPERIPIAIDVLNAQSMEILARRKWVLVPFSQGLEQPGHQPWDFRGFMHWQAMPGAGLGASIEPSDWGIRAVGNWHPLGERHVELSWHQAPRWGRYVGFVGDQVRWRLGHQVFLGERLDGLSRLGEGFSGAWQSNRSKDPWQVGWITFKSRGIHYQSPWWSWDGWRLAYIDASSVEANSPRLGGWWSLAYQHPSQANGDYRHARQGGADPVSAHHWKALFTGNRDQLAGRFEYRYRPHRHTFLGVLAESIPSNHLSELPSGDRMQIQSRHAVGQEASFRAVLSASRQRGATGIRYSRQRLEVQHWQPISNLFDAWFSVSRFSEAPLAHFRVGLGGIHQRTPKNGLNVFPEEARARHQTSESSLSLRLRGRVGSWHLSARLDTRGRFGLATHWQQPKIGLWRLSMQNQYTQLSWESLPSGPWRWSVAVEKRDTRIMPLFTSSRFDETGFSLDDRGDVRELKPANDTAFKVHVDVSRRVGRHQAWSLTLSPSTSDASDTTLWLRHRWRTSVPSPMPIVSRWVSRDRGHSLSGYARQLTSTGLQPVAGVLVSLDEKTTMTDAQGHYQFSGLSQGHYRLAIQDNGLDQRRLLTTDNVVDLWVGPDQASINHDGVEAVTHTHDWLWVMPARVIVDVVWPNDSPIDALTKQAVMDNLRLVGTCDACPSAHQRRTAKRNQAGQWVVDHLMPGHWRWQWVGALLPEDHAFLEASQWIEVMPSQKSHLTWVARYQPRPIEWQGTTLQNAKVERRL